LQATVEGDNEIVVDGKHFALKQFHFHTPSENLIKHHQYPLEAHFVNADENGNLAVVAVMFDQGSDNPFIASLTQTLPTKDHTQTLAQSFDVASLLPDTTQYYRFNGSLTTPPCSEGVRWFVMKQPKGLSADQLEKMHGMLGNNNRPVQDINARLVTEY
jgi:carbonic anhydrase